MATYHPPKIITKQASPAITADLTYEAHGKCGCQTIILSNSEGGTTEWRADAPGEQPPIDGCTDYSHVYKIVALENTKFRTVEVGNIASEQIISSLEFGTSELVFKEGSEILADFTHVNILSGTLILYRDCNQS